MKLSPAVSLLVAMFAVTSPAQAGWLDSVFGTDEKKVEKVETTADAQSTDLVGNVMSQLGLSKDQAEGGLGTLLSLAQSNLGDSDFSLLSNSIPGADTLLSAVPALASDDGMSGLLSQAGDLGKSFEGAAMVYDAFEQLGIKKEYVAPMVDIAKSYLETNGTEGTVDLLMKGVNSLL
ncbi:DUF2780 domain-containing protein [Shewanella sp. 10N.7]|uniref:DUF2780 domain-containing protein n=1 Tax=Shewanella sp. 10N.7 TaxID=2885093 RepID=UPI001E363243|nr:DUF2780 domain-containing protein [Shewanella sp. 10N.7]MCC4833870.1 DUF2780 domain-containing protein [Shewanella sp. 10N.7]